MILSSVHILTLMTTSLAQIDTNNYLVIYKQGEPDIHLCIERTFVGLKHIKRRTFNPSDVNILKIIPRGSHFQIRFSVYSLYFNKNGSEFSGKIFDANDPGFLFDIREIEDGVIIMHKNLCFENVGWEDARQNYHLDILPCNRSRSQIFEIRRVPMVKYEVYYEYLSSIENADMEYG